MAGGEYGNERHQAALRRAHVVELRDQGLTFRDIAVEVGISHQSAWEHYQKAMLDIPASTLAAHQANKAARLEAQLRNIDMQREVFESMLLTAHQTVTVQGRTVDVEDVGPVCSAGTHLGRLDDQEAKLLGLYAKTEVSHEGAVTCRIIGVPEDKL